MSNSNTRRRKAKKRNRQGTQQQPDIALLAKTFNDGRPIEWFLIDRADLPGGERCKDSLRARAHLEP